MKATPKPMNNKQFKDVLAEFFPAIPISDFKDYAVLELHINRHILEITLTKAEVLLFEKGFTDGELILEDPGKELNNNNILRSEILNWYLSLPDKYGFLFRKRSITITHGVIMTMSQFLEFQSGSTITEDADVINLSNRSIKINIEFSGCIFRGSINIANSRFDNLTFTRCVFGKGEGHKEPFNHKTIYPSIYANQAQFSGNLILKGNDISGKDYQSDFAGPIILTNAVVEKIFFMMYIQTSHDILCYFSRFGVINAYNLKVLFAKLTFTHSEAKEAYLQNCTLFGTLNDGEDDSSKQAADFFSFKADRFCIRANTTVIGGFRAMGMNISGVIDLEEAVFISRAKAGMSNNPDLDGSLDLSNTQASIIYLRKGFVSLGSTVVRNVSVKNIELNRSRFINFNQNVYGKSLIVTGARVANFIDFKPQLLNTEPYSFATQEELKTHLQSLIPVAPSILSAYPDIERCITYCLETTGIFVKLKEIEDAIVPGILACAAQEKVMTLHPSSLQNRIKVMVAKRYKPKAFARLTAFREQRIKRMRIAVIQHYAILVGEADLSSIFVDKKLDFAGALFYGREHDKNTKHYVLQSGHNAVNIKYAHINGDLFINDCDNIEYVPPFKAIGEVDLHSAKVNQFFINPLRGKDADTDWRATGFKYEYIYSGGANNARLLDNCEWFKDYLSQDNYLQPYQQLAAAFDKIGDDTRAKRVLITARLRIASKNPVREFPQLLLYLVIYIFSKLGMPASKALIAILLLFGIGAWGINYYAGQSAFHYDNLPGQVAEVNQYLYSLKNMVPFNVSIYDPIVPRYEEKIGRAAASFLLWHKLFSTVFLALLLIGISKLTKDNNQASG